MGIQNLENILIVYKKSVFEQYTGEKADQKTDKYARDTPSLRESHDIQQRARAAVISAVERTGIPYQDVYRGDLSQELVDKADFVICVGGDGTVLEVSHYLLDTPLLGVNSDPKRSVGYFSLATVETIREYLTNLKTMKITPLQRLQVAIDGEDLPHPALNEILMSHADPAETARYRLFVDGTPLQRKEATVIKSSGLLVCTAAGSTGWMYEAGGKIMPLGSKRMQFHVREQRGSGFHFAREEIVIESQTREGKVYLDSRLKYDFTVGSTLTIRNGHPLRLVGDLRKKQRMMKNKRQ